MNAVHLLIGAMLLIQFSMYAQSTGQVTLSIRLYPIQIIEVDSFNAQTLEVSSESVLNSINKSSYPNQLSTYSTSQFALKVDSVTRSAFSNLRDSNAVHPQSNKSINRVIDAERYNYETDGDDLHIVYSMETL